MFSGSYILAGMSSYEAAREKNIARNNKLLESLGFQININHVDRASSARIKKPAAAKRIREPVAGVRSSKRLKVAIFSTQADRSITESITKKHPDQRANEFISHPAKMHFKNEPSIGKKDFLQWDIKKKHQHLELSSSKRTVATTGCAGYGAVLARAEVGAIVSSEKKNKDIANWKVSVLAEGVGGFSVGVCIASAVRPFKSMGNRRDSWVFHASGQILHNRTSKHVKGCEDGYKAGDIIDVIISPHGELIFAVNGKHFGTKEILPVGKYTLCCQPYMGGVGRLNECVLRKTR